MKKINFDLGVKKANWIFNIRNCMYDLTIFGAKIQIVLEKLLIETNSIFGVKFLIRHFWRFSNIEGHSIFMNFKIS